MLRYKTETRPGLVTLYDIRPGNGAGPFLQPRSPHGATNTVMMTICISHQLFHQTTNYLHTANIPAVLWQTVLIRLRNAVLLSWITDQLRKYKQSPTVNRKCQSATEKYSSNQNRKHIT